jgi:hypothetical protein
MLLFLNRGLMRRNISGRIERLYRLITGFIFLNFVREMILFVVKVGFVP